MVRAPTGTAGLSPMLPRLPSLGAREGVLFLNFFLVIMAYYLVKPASRSLIIDVLGARQLPWIWIGTALTLGVLIERYHWLVARLPRLTVVLGTNALVIAGLVVFWVLLQLEHGARFTAWVAVAFYIYIDILSVVLVEQFWSLTNTLYASHEGKRVYGFIGTGGLLGGAWGGGTATWLLHNTPVSTEELLLVAALVLLAVVMLNAWMGRKGYYHERPVAAPATATANPDALLMKSASANTPRVYLWLIAALLLMAQLAEPIVEYQLSRTLEDAYSERDQRTAFLGELFMWLSVFAIAVNLVVTPLVHHYGGIMVGLAIQPVLLFLSACWYVSGPTLMTCAYMKIADRGLSYSINRASKELLYVLVDPLLVYRAKAWIDMFGYRAFKVLGALLIEFLSHPGSWVVLAYSSLSSITLGVCVIWVALIIWLATEYRRLQPVPV